MPEAILLQPGPLAAIAKAIRGRLELAFPDRFDHQWMPPRINQEVWKAFIRRPPFVGIGFDNFKRVQTQTNLAVISEWTVCVVIKNERGVAGLLFGDSLAPGLLTVAEVAATVLHGFTIPGQGTAQVISAENMKVEGDEDQTIGMVVIGLTVNADLSIKNVLGGAIVTPAALTTQQIEWTFDGTTLTDTITNTGTS